MKSGLLALCLVLVPLTAQNVPEYQTMTVGPAGNALFPIPKVRLGAQNLRKDSAGVVYLKGSAQIELGDYTLLADEAEYRTDTGEIQPSGNVRLKPIREPDSTGLRQFGIK